MAMDKREAYRRKVMHDWGWLGRYTWDELSICDQLDIDRKVDELMEKDKADALLAEATPFLDKSDCPCCGYPKCGHNHTAAKHATGKPNE